MKSNYYEAWEAMNKLQEHSSKLNTIKDLIEAAVKCTNDKNVISLLAATENMIGIYVDEFDDLFRAAWDKTIKQDYTDRIVRFNDAIADIDTTNDGILLKRDQEIKDKIFSCNKNDQSPECQKSWNDFWEDVDENHSREYNLREAEYYNKRAKLDISEDRVVKWQLPVDVDGLTGDCLVQFPDDLLEAANLKEGDTVEWINRKDGSFELRKVNGTK